MIVTLFRIHGDHLATAVNDDRRKVAAFHATGAQFSRMTGIAVKMARFNTGWREAVAG